MGLLGWIIALACLLGGLALRQDMPPDGSAMLSSLLLGLAILACPMLWQGSAPALSRGQRIAAGMALLLTMPMILLPA